MSRPPLALVAILVEAGLSPAAATHLCRNLDRQRLSGLGSDDLADLLLKWAARKYMPNGYISSGLIPVVGYDDVDGQITLFRIKAGKE